MGFLGFSETRQVVAAWSSHLRRSSPSTAEQRLFLARSSVELEVRQWFHLAGIIRIPTSSGSFMCLWTAGRKNDYRPHLFSIDTCDLSNWHIFLPMWQLFFIRTRSDLAFNMHINGIFAFWDAGGESVLYAQESQFFFKVFVLWMCQSSVVVCGTIVVLFRLIFGEKRGENTAVNDCLYICQIPQPVWWINNNGDNNEAVLCLI